MSSRVAAQKRSRVVLNGLLGMSMALVATAPLAHAADNARLPEIKTTAANVVPACVTPDRLMTFLASRNTRLPAKFDTIAMAYRDLGNAAHIRWDYAFFQMILETNYLMYRRGDGSSGDVGQTQNNFAGIGATGGGVPGDRYPDVRTGVLAHVQHLLAYAGERVERPVATRTREYQGDIIEISRKLNRSVTFSDLSRRWAVDSGYGKNIETIAELYRRVHCVGAPDLRPQAPNQAHLKQSFRPPNQLGASAASFAAEKKATTSSPLDSTESSKLVRTIWRRSNPKVPVPRQVAVSPAVPSVAEVAVSRAEPTRETASAPESQSIDQSAGVGRFAAVALAPVVKSATTTPAKCRIYSASYGGSAAVLIRTKVGTETQLTALTVAQAQRLDMAENYLLHYAPGGEIVANYGHAAEALAAARALCAIQASK
jgi:hypothetical protein